jgi:hypothetical protein
MDITPYVDNLRRQLAVAAETGGEDARALAERLTAPLESAIRLTLLDALSAAADEITRDLAPGSVDLRLRGGDPAFVVTPPPTDRSFGATGDDSFRPGGDRSSGDVGRGGSETASSGTAPGGPASSAPDADEGAMSRLNFRLPEQLKVRIEEAASRERLSANAWLVRVTAAALERDDRRSQPRGSIVGQRYTGWVR